MKAKKIITVIVTIALMSSMITIKANATENLGADIEISRIAKNILIVNNKNTKTSDKIVFNEKDKSATIYNSNGEVQYIYTDKNGNILFNGEIIIEKVVEKNIDDNLSRPMTRANITGGGGSSNNKGYKYITTFKTRKSLYENSANIAIGLIGLIPGIGTVATIAGIITGVKSYVSKEVYIKVVQYGNTYARMLKNEIYFYKNSNYTGLIKKHTTYSRMFG